MCIHLITELQDKAKIRTERTEKSKNRVKHFNTVLVTDRIKADRNSIKM